MKVNELIREMGFSHRPVDGISVGIAVIGGVAYMAAGFVRDGDQFNRKLARHILAQRVVSTVETDKAVHFVAVSENIPAKVDARAIVREFRKGFKPDPRCQDGTFANYERETQWLKIMHYFSESIKAAVKA